MRLLTLSEVLTLYNEIMLSSGGAIGIRDLGLLESALAIPLTTINGVDAYPTTVEKLAALGYSIIQNHPFVDGNKRIGHAVMEVSFLLNGFQLQSSTDESEELILALASGSLSREGLIAWLRLHVEKI